MKKLNLFFLFASLIIFSSFNEKYEQISIDENLSIKIPDYFIIHEKPLENGKYIIAESDNDRLCLSKQTFSGLDTLELSKRREILVNNLKGFIRGVNGENLENQEIENQGKLIQSSFSFEIMKPELLVGYGRIIIQRSSLIILTYFTKTPATVSSLKTKDMIFNSLKMD